MDMMDLLKSQALHCNVFMRTPSKHSNLTKNTQVLSHRVHLNFSVVNTNMTHMLIVTLF